MVRGLRPRPQGRQGLNTRLPPRYGARHAVEGQLPLATPPIASQLCSGASYLLQESLMATKLDKTIKREIELDGQPFMVAISPEGVKLTQKGFRKGREMAWKALWDGGREEGGAGGSGSSGGGM